MYNPFNLNEKTILVTGASSGIGKTTAIECSKLGANVIITGRNKERLNETFSLLDSRRNNLQIIADLSIEEDIKRLVGEVPMLDGLVSNAGIVWTQLVTFYKKEEIEKMLTTNSIAPAILTKLLIKNKKLKKPSSIVFTSSAEGVYGTTIGNGIYGMTKAALNSYMLSAALELSRKGIRCNSVNPSMVETNLALPTGAISKEQLEEDVKRYPLGRYGKAEDIAWAIIYLLSDAASWVTGTALKIDGGRTLKM